MAKKVIKETQSNAADILLAYGKRYVENLHLSAKQTRSFLQSHYGTKDDPYRFLQALYIASEKAKEDAKVSEEEAGNFNKAYWPYFLIGFFSFSLAISAEIYSSYYKLKGFNRSLKDFNITQLSLGILIALIAINLVFSAHMSINQNAKDLHKKYKKQKEEKSSLILAIELFIGEILKLKVVDALICSLYNLLTGSSIKSIFTNNKNQKRKSVKEESKKTRGETAVQLLAQLLVVGNVIFFVITTTKGSFSAANKLWNTKAAYSIAVLCGLGAFIGGIGFSYKKISKALPHIVEMVTGKWKTKEGYFFKTEEGWKRTFSLALLIIVFGTAGANYALARETMLGILPIISLVLFTVVSYLVCLYTLYKTEITLAENENEGDDKEEIKKESERKGLTKEEEQKSTRVRTIIFTFILFFSTSNLLISGISGGFGWEEFAHNKLSFTGIALYCVFGFAVIATIFNRFCFSDFWHRTGEMRDKFCNLFSKTDQKKKGQHSSVPLVRLLTKANLS